MKQSHPRRLIDNPRFGQHPLLKPHNQMRKNVPNNAPLKNVLKLAAVDEVSRDALELPFWSCDDVAIGKSPLAVRLKVALVNFLNCLCNRRNFVSASCKLMDVAPKVNAKPSFTRIRTKIAPIAAGRARQIFASVGAGTADHIERMQWLVARIARRRGVKHGVRIHLVHLNSPNGMLIVFLYNAVITRLASSSGAL